MLLQSSFVQLAQIDITYFLYSLRVTFAEGFEDTYRPNARGLCRLNCMQCIFKDPGILRQRPHILRRRQIDIRLLLANTYFCAGKYPVEAIEDTESLQCSFYNLPVTGCCRHHFYPGLIHVY